MAAEVVVRVQDSENPRGPSISPLNGTANGLPPYPVEESPVEVIVRAEEILLVVLVLVIWVAAIALFFNRWGKIRMLEPYQPKFQQQHRSSCPMGGESVISPQVSVKTESEKLVQRMKHAQTNTISTMNDHFNQRMSFSKYNVNCMGDNPLYTSLPSPNPLNRKRQNSVFVGSSTMAVMNPPRRVKSAIDIQHMILSDYSPGSLSGCSSLLPMMGSFNKRPSITIDKVSHPRNRRQSSVILDQMHHGYQHPSTVNPRPYHRRPSCLDRPLYGRHRHFISFDQPTTSWDRRTSITIEKPSRKHQTLSFEHSSSVEQPSLIIDPPSTSQEQPPITITETEDLKPISSIQRSCPESMVCLHQPSSTRRPSFHLEMPEGSPSRHRLSVSLDNPAIRMERRLSDGRTVCSPCSTSFDESQIKLSNLEYSKVSDV